MTAETVLVTGAAGYIGSVLCETLLDAGHRVLALDNLTYRPGSLHHLCADRAFDFVLGDVRDERLMSELVGQSDVVVPLAAVVGAPAGVRDPWLTTAVNLEAIRLLQRLRHRGQLVIYPNTNSGYGTAMNEQPCTEESPLRPVSLYARTKVEAESVVMGEPNTISLRLATVFGASPRLRVDLLVNQFVYAAVREGSLVIFEKDFKRNYIHIRDVADCVVHCIANAGKMVGRVYNAGLDAANLSKMELAQKIKAHIPTLHLQFLEMGRDPDQRNYVISNERLRQAGFQARRSLDDGIRELIKCYRLLGRSEYANA